MTEYNRMPDGRRIVPAEDVDFVIATDAHWFFDPLIKRWGRFDGKFYAVEWEAEPYGRPFVNEEPMVPEPESGPRIVGHIVVLLDENDVALVDQTEGLNGEVIVPTTRASLSNPKAVTRPETFIIDADLELNPKRLKGVVLGSIVRVAHDEFPAGRWMPLAQFMDMTTDAGTAALLGKYLAKKFLR